jgi:Na+-transporting NADH:ubiquinone oxidoreductase subunit NqrA
MISLTFVVLLASATMGGERALVPRDWLPPVLALIVVVVQMIRDGKGRDR